MKKSYFDYFSFSVYRYAPESMKIYWKGKQVELYFQEYQQIGYILLTKGKKAALDEIKKIYRNRSIFADKKTINKKLCVGLSNGEYAFINEAIGRVNIYDINEKLYLYKLIKECYNDNRFAIKEECGIMEEYGKFKRVTERITEKPELLKKICFI